MLARLQLTEEENDFYRLIMYRVGSDHVYGQPYLQKAFNRLIPASVEGSRTMAVDANWYVYIDFAEMMIRGVDYASGIMNHEIWHLIRRHHKSMEYLPPAPGGYKKEKLANIAADLEINDDIADLLPITAIKPERSTFHAYKEGQSLNDYYLQLLKSLDKVAEDFDIEHQGRPDSKKQEPDSSEKQKSEDSGTGDPSEGKDDSEQSDEFGKNDPSQGKEESQSSDETGKGEPSEEKGEGSPSDESGDGDPSGNSGESSENQTPSSGKGSSETGKAASDAGKGSPPTTSPSPSPKPQKDFWKDPDCGGAVGNPQEYELDSPDGEQPEEMSEGEEDALIRKLAADIKEYKEEHGGVGSGRSKMLARLSKWADSALRAKHIPWKQQLRGQFLQSYASARGKLIYVRNRPARRQPVPDIIYPALRSPKPTIGIAIDVSGSNLGNLKVILTELSNIMKAAGVRGKEVQAFAVDVAASKIKFVSNPLTLLDDLPIGGGTRMAPGYRQLAEMGQNISILITDGYVDDYPKEKPEGRKRTKFITCIVMSEQDRDSDQRIQKAERIMGKWCKVIPIYTSEL